MSSRFVIGDEDAVGIIIDRVSADKYVNQPRDDHGRWTSGGGGRAYPGFNDPNTPKVQIEALQAYTTSGYQYLNAVARGADVAKTQKIYEDLHNVKIETHITALDEAIASTPALSENATLYRSIREGNTAEMIRQIPNGGSFSDAGYVSTSSDERYGLGFSGTDGIKMVIEVPAGMHGLDVDKFMGATGPVTEQEVILPRKTTFKIERREYSTIYVKAENNG